MDVVDNPSATLAARVSSELILIAQYQPGVAYDFGVSWNDLLISNVGTDCRFAFAVHSASDTISVALQAYKDTLVAHFRAVRRDPTYPAPVQHLADCANGIVVGSDVPSHVDPSWITAEYLCDNTFVIRNSGTEWVHLSYAVGGTEPATGEIGIPPTGESLFWAPKEGPLTLRAADVTIAVVENSGAACS